MLKMGSLFDGSGGFPLASAMNGIEAVWASEVEPFPIRVTTKKLPFMKHYGDISKINGADLEPVDIITGGSPCQDMSVAGKRAGLDGERSGLFREQIRIIKEMREKTNGEYPRFMVWENVPGAFSSNKGQDFRCVLEETTQIKISNFNIPMPDNGKWNTAGLIMDEEHNFSLAWRVLDAQYWGVPQRRRRVFLVADFNGTSAGEILFKRESLSRHIKEVAETWKRVTENARDCFKETGQYDRLNSYVFENHSQDTRYVGPLEVAQTVSATYGMGGNNQPFVVTKCYDIGDRRSVAHESENVSPTLTSKMGTGGNNVPIVLDGKNVFGEGAFGMFEQGRVSTLKASGGVLGEGSENLVGVPCLDVGNPNNKCDIDVSPTLCARIYKDAPVVCVPQYIDASTKEYPKTYDVRFTSEKTKNARANVYETDTSRTVDTTGNAPDSNQGGIAIVQQEPYYTVRKLTPLECARLQGFPDWWTDNLEMAEEEITEDVLSFWREVFETHREIVTGAKKPKTDKQIKKWLMNPYSDSALYKMWGNGVALPCVLYVIEGIKEELSKEREVKDE